MAGVKTEYTSSSCHGDPSDKRISENLNCGGEKKISLSHASFSRTSLQFFEKQICFFLIGKAYLATTFGKKSQRKT